MKTSTSLIWTDASWRDAYFGRRLTAPRLPPGYRSHARQEWDEEDAREREREAQMARELAAHARRLAEQERFERLRTDVETYGSEVVEVMMRRIDPTFSLPVTLQHIERRKEP